MENVKWKMANGNLHDERALVLRIFHLPFTICHLPFPTDAKPQAANAHMTFQRPPPLDYAYQRDTPPPPEGTWTMFVLGAIAGLVFSVAYYALLISFSLMGQMPFAGFGAVAAKVVVGIRMMRSPKWRRFGIGLLVSIPLAVLILVGLCFAIFAKM
jgi:hypothetical protein